jgi:hypothetical protein
MLTQHHPAHPIFSLAQLDQSVLCFLSSFSTAAMDLFLARNSPPSQPAAGKAKTGLSITASFLRQDAEEYIFETMFFYFSFFL